MATLYIALITLAVAGLRFTFSTIPVAFSWPHQYELGWYVPRDRRAAWIAAILLIGVEALAFLALGGHVGGA